jgi:hypothetical protein
VTTIPDVQTIHERSAWEEPGYRMQLDFTRVPPIYPRATVRQPVAHYTGAMNVPDGDPGDEHNVAGFLRRAQRDYYENRTGGGYTRISDGRFFPGYPLGYNFGVDWLGGVWVLRGFDFLSAATNGHNGYTVAVLFFVDGANPANDLMWQSARAIGRGARTRSTRLDFARGFTDHGSLRINTGTGTVTACAGAGIRAQLSTQGVLDQEDEPMTVSYFKLAPDALTVWATSDNLAAYRLEESQVNARGVDPFKVPVLPATEADKYVYHSSGLPRASVR